MTNDFPCCFAGALSDMPAVQAFAMYAGMSLLINFVLQMTLFVALFSLDVAREEVRYELYFSISLFSLNCILHLIMYVFLSAVLNIFSLGDL